MPTEAGHRLYVKLVHPRNPNFCTCATSQLVPVGIQCRGMWLTGGTSRARHLGYRRNKHTTHPNRSLVKIEGVDNTEAANFYLGKKIAFIHKAPKETRGTHTRVIWGKVVRPHGRIIIHFEFSYATSLIV
ncbi:hypothetical protein CIB48_g11428 [Xylaria polymorpha]|nr:hypothetical protein CIB48_g11428 [Xylaria polymorpha]